MAMARDPGSTFLGGTKRFLGGSKRPVRRVFSVDRGSSFSRIEDCLGVLPDNGGGLAREPAGASSWYNPHRRPEVSDGLSCFRILCKASGFPRR